MGEEVFDQEDELERRKNRFRILVCVDGSDESERGLSYAANLGASEDCDIIILYVRPVDQGLRTGGLQVRVARENMLSWGLELPGIKYLNKGKEFLIERGDMAEDWAAATTHTDVAGDPLGDNKVEYRNKNGKSIVLKLKVAPTIAQGILDQYELGPYDIIIMGASGRWGGITKTFWDPAVAEKVAVHAPCSVVLARDLVKGKGYLLCTDGSDQCKAMLRTAADYIKRTKGWASVLSVAFDAESENEAKANVEAAREILKSLDVEPVDLITRVGNPVEQIIEVGSDFSLICVGDTGKTGLKRFFMGSVAFKVMEFAKNTVVVVR